MIIPYPKDAKHKAWLYRILSALFDDIWLASVLRFKGGTCAAMLGWLDRFSVDLDFDFVGKHEELSKAGKRMEKIFEELGLEIKDSSKHIPQYFLRYPAPERERNTVKIDMSFPPAKANRYEAMRFEEVDRIIPCQTLETMFANKLVALTGRFEKHGSIAGRDVYDIHHFFESGRRYDAAIIEEQVDKTVLEFLEETVLFVERQVTDDILAQDMNTLVPYEKFRKMRKTLKLETLMFLRDEINRLRNTRD